MSIVDTLCYISFRCTIAIAFLCCKFANALCTCFYCGRFFKSTFLELFKWHLKIFFKYFLVIHLLILWYLFDIWKSNMFTQMYWTFVIVFRWLIVNMLGCLTGKMLILWIVRKDVRAEEYCSPQSSPISLPGFLYCIYRLSD